MISRTRNFLLLAVTCLAVTMPGVVTAQWDANPNGVPYLPRNTNRYSGRFYEPDGVTLMPTFATLPNASPATATANGLLATNVLRLLEHSPVVRSAALRHPPMGVNTWYMQTGGAGGGYNEASALAMGANMLTNGWVAAGYNYLQFDEGWSTNKTDSVGSIIEDTNKFPSGLTNTIARLKAMGIDVGLYVEPNHVQLSGKTWGAPYTNFEASIFKLLTNYGVSHIKFDQGGNVGVSEQKYRSAWLASVINRSHASAWFDLGFHTAAGDTVADKGTILDDASIAGIANVWRSVPRLSDVGCDANCGDAGWYGRYHAGLKRVDSIMSQQHLLAPGHYPGGDVVPTTLSNPVDTRDLNGVRSIFSAFCMGSACLQPLGVPTPDNAWYSANASVFLNREAISIDQDPFAMPAKEIHGLYEGLVPLTGPSGFGSMDGVQVFKKVLGSTSEAWPHKFALLILNRETNTQRQVSFNFTNLPGVPRDAQILFHSVWTNAITDLMYAGEGAFPVNTNDALLYICTPVVMDKSLETWGRPSQTFYPNQYLTLSSAANSGVYTNGDVAPNYLLDYRINGSGYWAFGLRIPRHVTNCVTRIAMNWSHALPLHGTNVFTSYRHDNVTARYDQLNEKFIFDLTNGFNTVRITNTFLDTTSEKEIKITNAGTTHTNTAALTIPFVECWFNGTYTPGAQLLYP